MNNQISDVQRTQLLDLSRQLRKIAGPVGPMHSFWDVMFDIEAFLDGEQTLLSMSANQWIVYAEGLLSTTKQTSSGTL